MTVLEAAKQMKYFIEIMPPGECFFPATGCDVRETESYKLAASTIDGVEGTLSTQNADAAKSA